MYEVRVGIIGAGNMGSLHARVAADSRGATLLGVYDTDSSRAVAVAGRLQSRAFDSLEALVAACDALIVASPSSLHHDHTMRCIEQGKHVLVEKPVAADPAEAKRLVRAAHDAGVVAHVGHIERFNPAFGELARALEGRTVRSLDFRRTSPHTEQAQDVDVTLDLMIHDLDLMLALTDSGMVHVSAVAHRVSSEQPDLVAALVELDNGVSASLTASKASFEKVRIIEAHADDATVRADLLTREVWIHQRLDDTYRESGSFVTYQQQTVIERVLAAPVEPLRAEHHAFTDAVRGISDCGVSLDDGTRALSAALTVVAAYSESGEPTRGA